MSRSHPRGPTPRCHAVRDAVSASLDGEAAELAASAVADHLAECAECRAYAAGATALHRTIRVNPAPEVPDLTPAIMATIDADAAPAIVRGHAERALGLRIVLAVIGVVQLAVAVPALVLGDDAGLPTHDARHLGSVVAALAIGFLIAAWRPSLAGGLVPLVAAFVVLQIVTTVADVVDGATSAGAEMAHGLELAGLLALFLLARATPTSRRLVLA
jgi:predicted anti-sigma-YlaC factor YlaD